MTKGGPNKKQTKGQRRDEIERKRDDRVRRHALKKERKAKEYLEDDQDFASFSNQLEALGLKIKDILGDGLVVGYKINTVSYTFNCKAKYKVVIACCL